MKTKLLFVLVLFLSLQNIVLTQIPHYQCRNNVNKLIQNLVFTKDSMLVAVGSSCIVLDVNMTIDTLIHTWDSDMRMYLQKGNQGALIINMVGGGGDNFINTILNDSASLPITSGVAPFRGTFRPSNPLTALNGASTDGYWKFIISDTAGGDTGFLKAWCIRLIFTCPSGGIQTVEIPNTYRLYQNYPNPFNPVTKIKYGVPKNGYVKLTIYDELGKEVDVIVEGHREANTYEAVFDATNLPSGVYYYKLEAEGFADTKKMVIIK